MTVTENRFIGGSGAVITLHNNIITKQGVDIKQQYDWYNIVNENFPNVLIPKVEYLNTDSKLNMEFINGSLGCTNKSALEKVFTYIDLFSTVATFPEFDTYIKRIETHLINCNHQHKFTILKLLSSVKTEMNKHRTFCHGDLIMGNIIHNTETNNVYLIDPIYKPDLWSSYLLDYARLYVSCHNNYDKRFTNNISFDNYYEDIKTRVGSLHYLVLVLELTYWVRMIKWKPNDVNEINEIIDSLLIEIL